MNGKMSSALAANNVETVTLLVKDYAYQMMRDWPFGEPPTFSVHEYRDIVTMMTQQIIRGLQRVAADDLPDIRYPANWIEAVKERFAPRWLRKRWPVRYTHWEVTALYPTLKLPEYNPVVRIARLPDLYVPAPWPEDFT